MSQVPILLWGGPKDGEEMVLSEVEPYIRIAVLDGNPADFHATEDFDPATAKVDMSYLVYEKTTWVKASGHRIYKYATYKKP